MGHRVHVTLAGLRAAMAAMASVLPSCGGVISGDPSSEGTFTGGAAGRDGSGGRPSGGAGVPNTGGASATTCNFGFATPLNALPVCAWLDGCNLDVDAIPESIACVRLGDCVFKFAEEVPPAVENLLVLNCRWAPATDADGGTSWELGTDDTLTLFGATCALMRASPRPQFTLISSHPCVM